MSCRPREDCPFGERHRLAADDDTSKLPDGIGWDPFDDDLDPSPDDAGEWDVARIIATLLLLTGAVVAFVLLIVGLVALVGGGA